MEIYKDGVVVVSAVEKHMRIFFPDPMIERRCSIENSFKQTLKGTLFSLAGENLNIRVKTSKSWAFFNPGYEIQSDNTKVGSGVLSNKFPPWKSTLELHFQNQCDVGLGLALAGLMWRYLVLPPRSM
jgi:hypothetical protein